MASDEEDPGVVEDEAALPKGEGRAPKCKTHCGVEAALAATPFSPFSRCPPLLLLLAGGGVALGIVAAFLASLVFVLLGERS